MATKGGTVMGKRNQELPAPGLCRLYAACYIGVCVRSLDEMRARGKGPHHFRIGDEVRYWPADLDRHLLKAPNHAALFRKLAVELYDPHIELVPEPEAMLNTLKAARSLGVCPRTMSYWRKGFVGPKFVKVNGRVWYPGRDMRSYVQFERQEGAL